MSIHPDDTFIMATADRMRARLAVIEKAAKTGPKELGACLSAAVDLHRRAERILAIVRRYHNRLD